MLDLKKSDFNMNAITLLLENRPNWYKGDLCLFVTEHCWVIRCYRWLDTMSNKIHFLETFIFRCNTGAFVASEFAILSKKITENFAKFTNELIIIVYENIWIRWPCAWLLFWYAELRLQGRWRFFRFSLQIVQTSVRQFRIYKAYNF